MIPKAPKEEDDDEEESKTDNQFKNIDDSDDDAEDGQNTINSNFTLSLESVGQTLHAV